MDVFRGAQGLDFFNQIHDIILILFQIVGEQKLQVDLLFELELDLV